MAETAAEAHVELALVRERVKAIIARHESDAAEYRRYAENTQHEDSRRSFLADAQIEDEAAAELRAALAGSESPLDDVIREAGANAVAEAAHASYDRSGYVGHPNTWGLQERRDRLWRDRLESRAEEIREGLVK